MFLNKDGLNDKFYQYLCTDICQVKNTINEITKTNSVTSDWKELCCNLKKMVGVQAALTMYFLMKMVIKMTVTFSLATTRVYELIWFGLNIKF